jgi:hypothetical protein
MSFTFDALTPKTTSTQSALMTPILFLVSATNDPTNKVLEFQSDSPFVYNIYKMPGRQFIYQTVTTTSRLSNGRLYVDADLSPYIQSYPATISVEIFDGISWKYLNTMNITLVGGDVYYARLAGVFIPPSANGWVMMADSGVARLFKMSRLAEESLEETELHLVSM